MPGGGLLRSADFPIAVLWRVNTLQFRAGTKEREGRKN